MEIPIFEIMENEPDKVCIFSTISNKMGNNSFDYITKTVDKNFSKYRYYTYADIKSMITRFQFNLENQLSNVDLSKQNNWITIILPMSIDLYVTMLATFNANQTIAFVDPSRGMISSLKLIKRLKPKIFITNPRGWFLYPLVSGSIKISASKRSIPSVKSLFKFSQPYPNRNINPVVLDPASTGVVTLSSGSTGQLKIVSRSHKTLQEQRKAIVREVGYTNTDIEYSTLPIFLLGSVVEGITSVLPIVPSSKPFLINSHTADQIFTTMSDLRVTLTNGAPNYLKRLTYEKQRNDNQLYLRKLFIGGAPVSLTLIDKISQIWETEVISVFGSTEAEPISTISSKDLTKFSNIMGSDLGSYCIGKPIEILKTDQIKSQNYEFFSNTGNFIGYDLMVMGPNVVSDLRSDGWVNTKDIITFDKNGLLWLVGNRSNRIKVGNFDISPYILEETILENSKIKVAIKQCEVGEKPICVFAESNKSLSANIGREIRNSINQNLPNPHKIMIKKLNNLPRDNRHKSKVLYSKLKCC